MGNALFRRNSLTLVRPLSYRNTDFTEKFFSRLDVTEEFPFLVTKLSPYYEI
jgi:hypothetical protein